MKIPSHYLPVMPYLILEDARGFLNFAKAVFGAEEQEIYTGEDDTIMHGEIKIHNAVIMIAEAGDIYSAKSAGMYIYVENVDDVYDKALNNGAKSIIPPEKKDYGYTAGFDDEYGNQWWIVQGEN